MVVIHQCIYFFRRQRLLEILNTGGFQAPIIVFVNQKKTADMVAKDLQRGGVCAVFTQVCCLWINQISSGTPPRFILERIKNNEKHRYSHCAMANQIFSWPPILPVVVLMSKTSAWLSISKWLAPLRPMCIVSVCLLYDSLSIQLSTH
jgi:hypothetical protein